MTRKQDHEPHAAKASQPDIRSADPNGMRHEKRQATSDGRSEGPVAPRTGGVPKPEPDTSRSRVANRDVEGPRKAGTTPRPTDKPLG
jgi:hypothetical protein